MRKFLVAISLAVFPIAAFANGKLPQLGYPATFTSAPVSPAYVGSAANGSANSASFSISYTGTAGDTLVACYFSTSNSAVSVSDNNGNWSNIVPLASDGNGYSAAFLVNNIAGGSDTISFSGSQFGVAVVVEISHVGAYDTSAIASSGGGTSSFSVGPATPAQANEYALACVDVTQVVGLSAITPSSWSSGFTQRASYASHNGVTVADQLISGTSAVTATGAYSSTTGWNGLLLLFK